MRVASQTSIIEKRFGAERAIEMLAKTGFDAFDFTFFGMNENTVKAVYGENYREYMLSLKEISDKCGIKIALENMFVVDRSYKYILRFVNGACGTGGEFVRYMERLDPEWFIACIDTGHSGIAGQKVHYAIRQLGHKYLHALHVQDNNFFEDTHTAPYFGLINWDEVCKALADIDYDGDFTFEAHRFLERIPEPLFMDTLTLLYKIGKYLADKIQSLKVM